MMTYTAPDGQVLYVAAPLNKGVTLTLSGGHRVEVLEHHDPVNIVDAIAMWSHWHGDWPFDGSRGDLLLDFALADAFRMILALDDTESRLRWIERQVYSDPTRDTLTRYQTVLARWWLQLYEDHYGCPKPAL